MSDGIGFNDGSVRQNNLSQRQQQPGSYDMVNYMENDSTNLTAFDAVGTNAILEAGVAAYDSVNIPVRTITRCV